MLLRVLTVLVASTAGLAIASLIYYSILQDGMIHRGSPRAKVLGNLLSVLAIVWFLFCVLELYYHYLPAMVVSALGMMITKLLWDIGDGLRYAGLIHAALSGFPNDTKLVRQFIQAATNYRQTQDLRAVALTMFAPDSRQIVLLDEMIAKRRFGD